MKADKGILEAMLILRTMDKCVQTGKDCPVGSRWNALDYEQDMNLEYLLLVNGGKAKKHWSS